MMVELVVVVVHAATFVHTLVEGLLCNMVCMSLFVLRGIFEGGEQLSGMVGACAYSYVSA